jgi:hypothetical protein
MLPLKDFNANWRGIGVALDHAGRHILISIYAIESYVDALVYGALRFFWRFQRQSPNI